MKKIPGIEVRKEIMLEGYTVDRTEDIFRLLDLPRLYIWSFETAHRYLASSKRQENTPKLDRENKAQLKKAMEENISNLFVLIPARCPDIGEPYRRRIIPCESLEELGREIIEYRPVRPINGDGERKMSAQKIPTIPDDCDAYSYEFQKENEEFRNSFCRESIIYYKIKDG
jgi:hypothetical protein